MGFILSFHNCKICHDECRRDWTFIVWRLFTVLIVDKYKREGEPQAGDRQDKMRWVYRNAQQRFPEQRPSLVTQLVNPPCLGRPGV